jgi:hypothetical protein
MIAELATNHSGCLCCVGTRRRGRLRYYARLRWSNTLRNAIRPRRHYFSEGTPPASSMQSLPPRFNSEGPLGGIPRGYWRGAPDLAIEVLSPDDSPAEMDKKLREYLEHGARAVWVVDPDAHAVAVHGPDWRPQTLMEPASLDGGPILPGFRCPLARPPLLLFGLCPWPFAFALCLLPFDLLHSPSRTAPRRRRTNPSAHPRPAPAPSGDMYAVVPSAVPGLVRSASDGPTAVGSCDTPVSPIFTLWSTFASPKSRILACPRSVTKMFAGLMSRCTIPFAWAASSASAICTLTSNNESTGNGLPLSRCFSVCPSS